MKAIVGRLVWQYGKLEIPTDGTGDDDYVRAHTNSVRWETVPREPTPEDVEKVILVGPDDGPVI